MILRHPAPSAASTSGAEVPAHARPMRWLRGTWSPTSTPPCLTGGSAHGLAAVDGVMRWLEERGTGYHRRRPGTGGAHRARAVLFDLAAAVSSGTGPTPASGGPRPSRRAADAGPARSSRARSARGRRRGRSRRRKRVGECRPPRRHHCRGARRRQRRRRCVRRRDRRSARRAAAPRTADPRLRRPTRGDVGAACRAGAAGDDEHDDRGRRHGLTLGRRGPPPGRCRPRRAGPGGAASHLLTDGDTFFGLATGTRERPAAVSSAEDVRQLNLLYAAAAMSSPGRSPGRPRRPRHGDRPPTGTCSRHRRRPGTSDQVVASLT